MTNGQRKALPFNTLYDFCIEVSARGRGNANFQTAWCIRQMDEAKGWQARQSDKIVTN